MAGKAKPDLLRRHGALEKVMKKYRGRALDFRTADCIRMARTHLVAMGHKPPPLPRYSNLAGAIRALRAAGFETIEELFDSLLPRIEPARMLPGDVAVLRGEPEPEGATLDSAVISLGLKVIGWHGALDEMVVMTPHEIKAAWRA